MQESPAGLTPCQATLAPAVREDSAVHVLAAVIDKFVSVEFENAVAQLHGLGLLLQHHPAFEQEVAAIRQLAQARDTLINVCTESRTL